MRIPFHTSTKQTIIFDYNSECTWLLPFPSITISIFNVSHELYTIFYFFSFYFSYELYQWREACCILLLHKNHTKKELFPIELINYRHDSQLSAAKWIAFPYVRTYSYADCKTSKWVCVYVCLLVVVRSVCRNYSKFSESSVCVMPVTLHNHLGVLYRWFVRCACKQC